MRPADRDLQHRILLFLTLRHSAPLKDLQIEVRDGIVTLRGRIDSVREKQTSVHCVERVARVSRVIDETQWRAPRRGRVPSRPRYSLSPALLKHFRERRRS
jgi:osmotically-inducible protein OsmY